MNDQCKHEKKSWDNEFKDATTLKNLSFYAVCKLPISSTVLYKFVPKHNFQYQGNILDTIQSFKKSVFIVTNFKETFTALDYETGISFFPPQANKYVYRSNILKNFYGLTSAILDGNFFLQLKYISHPPFHIYSDERCFCKDKKTHNFFNGKSFYSTLKTRNLSGYSRRISRRLVLTKDEIKLQIHASIRGFRGEKRYRLDIQMERKEDNINMEFTTSRNLGSIDILAEVDLCTYKALNNVCGSLG